VPLFNLPRAWSIPNCAIAAYPEGLEPAFESRMIAVGQNIAPVFPVYHQAAAV
jgi:hypothetical protein